MHRCRTVAQISLILSILNLVLAAPIVVPEKPRRDEMVVAEGVGAMPKKWRKLEAVDLSPRTSSGGASPSEASMSEGHPTPPLSSGSSDSVSNYLWLLEGPGPQPPASLHDPASPQLSSPASLEIPSPPPEELSTFLSLLRPHLQLPPLPISAFSLYPFFAHPLFQPPPSPSSSWTSGQSEIPPSPQHMGSDLAPTETYSPPHHSSASDGSMPSPEPISGGPVPIPEGLAPSHHLSSDRSTPSSPPTETPPNNAEFFNENVVKKVGIVAGAIIVGGALTAGIVTSQKHHQHRDCQDS